MEIAYAQIKAVGEGANKILARQLAAQDPITDLVKFLGELLVATLQSGNWSGNDDELVHMGVCYLLGANAVHENLESI